MIMWCSPSFQSWSFLSNSLPRKRESHLLLRLCRQKLCGLLQWLIPILSSPLISDVHVQIVLFSNLKSSCCILNLLDLSFVHRLRGCCQRWPFVYTHTYDSDQNSNHRHHRVGLITPMLLALVIFPFYLHIRKIDVAMSPSSIFQMRKHNFREVKWVT